LAKLKLLVAENYIGPNVRFWKLFAQNKKIEEEHACFFTV